MKKQALVTGGAGFVGTNLIKLLLENGYDVVSIDNYHTGLISNHITGVDYIDIDIQNINDISDYGNFDIVFHMAAIARIQPSFKYPMEYFQTNAVSTMKLAKNCADKNIPLVYAGSSSHHSGKFKNPYTFSKDVGEEIIQLFQQHYGLTASITRFYNVYGLHQLTKGDYCTLIGKWEYAVKHKQPFIIYGDGSKRRDFTHVSDIVNALFLIADKNAWGYTFELGTGTNYSINEIASMFNYTNIIYRPDNPGEATNTLCDNRLAVDILGWECKYNVKDYILNFRKQYE